MPIEPAKWKVNLEAIRADRQAGMSFPALSAKYGVNAGSIARELNPKPAKPAAKPDDATLDGSTQREVQGLEARERLDTASASQVSNAPTAPKDDSLLIDKAAARRTMNRAIQGKVDLSAQQSAMIRLALKDELEPEVEANPYAGTPTEELALRALTLAVSVLGLVRVAALLRSEAKAGTLDLGLDYEPPAEMQTESNVLEAAKQLPSSYEATVLEERETVEVKEDRKTSRGALTVETLE